MYYCSFADKTLSTFVDKVVFILSTTVIIIITFTTRCLAIAERPRCALVLAKCGRLELEDNILRTFLFSTTVTKLASKAIEFGEKKHKIKAITPFKVTQGH